MPTQMTADEFFRGLLAALRTRQVEFLSARQPDIHSAFHSVLRELRKPETRTVLDVDLLDVDYDPLYGQSGWFDRALTRAQRNFAISFVNPTYEKIQIRYSPEECKSILLDSGAPDLLLQLADVFYSRLSPIQQSNCS